jgi:3',5'-nucleoside bisphosphate phosphatase
VSQVDLHIHTTASDGRFSPQEIVRQAREYGLKYIAITDHDSIDGVIPAQKAAKKYPELTVLAGVEINTDIPQGELHILGYQVDCSHRELQNTLKKLRNSRIERARKMIERLGKLGVEIDFKRVRELAGQGAIGRPHIAQAMLEKGYIENLKEAFTRYISRGGPAYVERDKISPEEAVTLILRAQGFPVLAHPLTLEKPEELLKLLKTNGLAGIEAYYNGYTAEQIDILLQMAVKYQLIVTGGSDYHGIDETNETTMGGVEVPLEVAEKLLALKKQ